jgi:arginase family enzyme
LDGFRVVDAPAVGTPEKGGLVAEEFLRSLKKGDLRRMAGTEIVEFLPAFDTEDLRRLDNQVL